MFVMAGLLVSNERWRRTEEILRERLKEGLGCEPGPGFELHATELLSPEGDGPFGEMSQGSRNKLALSLLDIVGERNHQVLLQVVDKLKMADATPPAKEYGFDWKHPWDLSLAMTLTMFEDHLWGNSTGSSSAGMVFIDHKDSYLSLVRDRSKERGAAGGWRQLKKVMEIGYSAVSYANSMIQLTDLIAYTMHKTAESVSGYGLKWPPDAHGFFRECRGYI